MKKKLQIILNDESWTLLETMTKEANEGFKNGTINMSDIVNEILITAKIDVRALQAKHTNIRRSLRQMALQKNIDIDLAIKNLMELKTISSKRLAKTQMTMKGVDL